MNLALVDEKAMRARVAAVYQRMKQRARPKLWKSGKRAGVVRVPGISELPFTIDQLWQEAKRQIGPSGSIACPYCVAIGRKKPNAIDLVNCVFDHHEPLDHGGTWALSNLRCVCELCNTEKGRLSYKFFVGLMSNVLLWSDPRDIKNLCSCLRTHGVTQRIRFAPKGKPAVGNLPVIPAPPLIKSMTAAADDDW